MIQKENWRNFPIYIEELMVMAILSTQTKLRSGLRQEKIWRYVGRMKSTQKTETLPAIGNI